MKVDILAIGVHPDDIELSCSGYLLKEIGNGKKVALLDLTGGELGTRGTRSIRKQEALAAAKKMGASSREILNIGDGFFETNKNNILQIVSKIRKYQPTIVLANAVEDRHPDHGRAAQLVARACFMSGLRKVVTKSNNKSQAPWRPKAIYHYTQDMPLKPEVVVDISEYMDRKMELILTFKTQFFDPASKEPVSPISSPEFLEFIKAKAAVYGRYIQVRYAEGFNVARPVGVSSLLDLS
ncbi:MAG: bacillithiol biosynthesis deacetylase BshB1 [Saprospiraceae bacterium]